MSGYYYVRILDNIMDKEATVEESLLPILSLFHTQWQYTYHKYFAADHSFWLALRELWFDGWNLTLQDHQSGEITREQFLDISSQKSKAATIPVVAVLYRLQQDEDIVLWQNFYKTFQRFHQMHNDVFGWVRDFRSNSTTYFLDEAKRRVKADQSVLAWIAHGGIEWGLRQIQVFFADACVEAARTNNSYLMQYMEARGERLSELASRIPSEAKNLAKLFDAFKL